MLELDFDHTLPILPELNHIIEQVLLVQKEAGCRAANQALIDGVGLRATEVRNEAYYAEALDYHLGLMYAHAAEPELAASHFDRSNTLPADGGNLIFSDHVRQSIDLHRRQDVARRRGLPSILLATMPRSASASLTQTIAEMLDMPVVRVSAGYFPNYSLIPRWLNSFTPGGAITHDHFGATPFNLQVLRESQVREVFVLVRDPRPAAASWVVFSNEKQNKTLAGDEFEDHMMRAYRSRYIPWLQQWIDATAEPWLQVHWILSTQVRTAMESAVRNILEKLRPLYPAVDEYLKGPVTEVRANYVQGTDDAWRCKVSSRRQREMWELIPSEGVELFQFKE